MAIPKRTLKATVEIDDALMTVTSCPPAFTGEDCALTVQIGMTKGGAAYTASGATVEMYLFYPAANTMTDAVKMTLASDLYSADLTAALMSTAGTPLLCVQMTDTSTGALIVACAAPMRIIKVRGDTVITTRAPTPSEVVYVGRSPYIDPTTERWMVWNDTAKAYVDSDVKAVGTGIAKVNNVSPASNGNVTITGANIATSGSVSTTVAAKITALESKDTTMAGQITALQKADTDLAKEMDDLAQELEDLGLEVIDGKLCAVYG